eukprot:SAG22_NODE_16805_length_317_cov_0.917431_1_plen_91_part_01
MEETERTFQRDMAMPWETLQLVYKDCTDQLAHVLFNAQRYRAQLLTEVRLAVEQQQQLSQQWQRPPVWAAPATTNQLSVAQQEHEQSENTF